MAVTQNFYKSATKGLFRGMFKKIKNKFSHPSVLFSLFFSHLYDHLINVSPLFSFQEVQYSCRGHYGTRRAVHHTQLLLQRPA